MPSLTWPSKSPPARLPASLELDSLIFPQGHGYPPASQEGFRLPADTGYPNAVILGDNLAAMSALLPEFEGRIHLIYADPPFFTNRRYPARIGRGEDSRKPAEWQLADGYGDDWPRLDDYLDMLYARLHLMHRLLALTGTLYLHLDWHASAYARLLLDEIFGSDRLLNEIAWVYHGPSPIRSAFNRKHDTILVYTRSETYTFNVDAVRQPYDPNTVKTFASSPKAGFGKVPDLKRGKVPEDWWYFPVVARLHRERTGYPTQKPEALLERILLASSNPGDLVADFFCGSGTTAVVASRLGRRFIAGDHTWRAVHTTRARLVERQSAPFSLWRAGGAGEQVAASKPQSPAPPGLTIQHLGDRIQISGELRDHLDYWEVDPAWDGRVFNSFAQAARPRSSRPQAARPVAAELALPARTSIRLACARLVSIHGEVYQVEVNP